MPYFTVLQNLNDTPFNIGHVLCEKPLFSAPAEFRPQVSAVRQMKFRSRSTIRGPGGQHRPHRSGSTTQSRGISSGVASYGKGLKNNGSHMINLLLNLFGDPGDHIRRDTTPTTWTTTRQSPSGYSSTVTR